MSDVAKFVRWAQEAEAELATVKAERDRLREGITDHREDTLHFLIEAAGGGSDSWAKNQAEDHDRRLWALITKD
jgi:hypothetical protein